MQPTQLQAIVKALDTLKEALLCAEPDPKKQTVSTVILPACTIDLREGEQYAGIVARDDGTAYHLILLPYKAKGNGWNTSVIWAKNNGGRLPTRQELYLIFTNLNKKLQKDRYWTCEQTDSYKEAWCVNFYGGANFCQNKQLDNYACAVRTIPI